ncbi:hypothetical protein ACERK3_15825 [Phycisphaerales bacterium AB-hyl4]|uniref:RelA/SpoT domain-containing protein n=1 Tax=Natronomicrosphaera hydrolytica TaxID=3242702 RepID=A0ABV4UAH1_9BACT
MPPAIARRYREVLPLVENVGKRVQSILTVYCDQKGYPYVGRIKRVESLAEKIESGWYARWSELDDLYACTVVIPLLDDEPEVVKFLQDKFVVQFLRLRGSTAKSPDVFRFDATRFVGRLRPPPGVAAEEPLYQLPFEVQVRSAFEHAWTAATHALVYKSGQIDWRRKRLAAQLKAAVEQLDALVQAFERSAEPIVAHTWPDLETRATVAGRFQHLLNQNAIPSELEPKDWSRFADNFFILVKSITQADQHVVHRKVDAALDLVAGEIQRLSVRRVPRSISLIQLALGVLAEAGWVKRPLQQFHAPVTAELLDFYPAAGQIAEAFQIDR